MNIMYYEQGKHSAKTLQIMLDAFKTASEAEGETAIALPDDVTALQDVSLENLIIIRNIIDAEISKKTIGGLMATSSILNQVKISEKENVDKFIKAADESQSTQVCKEDWVKMGYTDSESEELAMLSNI